MELLPLLSQSRLVGCARIRRERMLPAPGEVHVTVGMRVDPVDIVARSLGVPRLRTIPLARYMHANETSLPKYMVKHPGDLVAEREVIAAKPEALGTLRRIYRAPSSGKIAALQGIWMTIELNETPIELTALYRGIVVNVKPRLGVVIEAVGALVQGIWGCGPDSYGVLKAIVDSPEQELSNDLVDASARGNVLLGGAGITEDALRHAAKERAAGVIVGTLAPELKEIAPRIGITVLVIEGFGASPMSKPVFDLLASHNGQEICLSVGAGQRGGTARPEAFVPATTSSGGAAAFQAPQALAPEIGSLVRVTSSAHEGKTGKIVSLPKLPQTLESGILGWGAEVDLEGESIFVPWQNLELVG